MRHTLLYMLATLVLAACGRRECPFSSNGDITESVTADILLPTTPVRDQGDSDLCWIYAMLATIETDRLAQGDSVTLSPLWPARHSLMEQATDRYLSGRRVSLRGTLPEAMRLLETYGIVAWDACRPAETAPSRAAARRAETLAQTLSLHRKGLGQLRSALDDALDSTLGPAPRNVFMYGMEYTPLEFVHSLFLPGEWQAYTSFTHHPFRKPFALEIPDNRQRHKAMNIPIGELLAMTVRSLRKGHPVAWEGSTAFLHEDRKEGKGEKAEGYPVLQQQRQRLFETRRLTDDHCMAIVGTGHDREGRRYFIMKNSWGKDSGHGGYVYISERQFALYTIMVMLNVVNVECRV